MLEDECLLGFHTWGDESVRRNAPIGLDDHLVEQESEVRLVDPELTLHHLRGQPVPAQHAARAEQVSAHAGLDPDRPRRWSARTAFGERGDRDTPACGSEEIAGESAEVGWLRLVDGVPACRRHHARTVPAATAVYLRPAVL
ncbi:hypothetical protein ACHIPZ_12050 [Antrihabitans sp. NCIMB 15449]|uniref:Uncharacterized protein n=1 Tax=Antrihabitans spumae TaxID=3373370 RepID=A0ABW7JP25_9NOCA